MSALLFRAVCAAFSAALLVLLLIAIFVLFLSDLLQPAKLFLRILAAPALLFYLLCRVQTVLCAHAVMRRIAALSM